CISAMIGDRTAALDFLTQAAGNGFPCYSFFESDPFLESIREEPRFHGLIHDLRVECDRYRRIYRQSLSSSAHPGAQREHRGPRIESAPTKCRSRRDPASGATKSLRRWVPGEWGRSTGRATKG